MLAESPQLKPETLVPFAVDMGNFKQVQFAARKVVAEEPRLDILVNNAAVLARPLDKESNGISVSFGINHLGPFLLIRELLPLLNKTQAEHPGVRIVNVASTAHYDVPTGARFGSLEDFNATYGSEDEPSANYLRYGYSKLASILHTKELQRRFDQEGVDFYFDRISRLSRAPSPLCLLLLTQNQLKREKSMLGHLSCHLVD